jgi:hypothetical protein
MMAVLSAMSEPLRQFILHFAPPAMAGLFLLAMALCLFPPRRRASPDSPAEVVHKVRLITRPAFVVRLFTQLYKQPDR